MVDGVNEDEVRRIARLAQLGVQDDEVAGWVEHFRGMLQFVSKLEEVDVDGVDLSDERALGWTELRDDRVRDVGEAGASLERAEALKRAPDSDDQCFLVPRVMES